MSIPLHGPDGVMDLIGVSLRDEKKQDRQATGKILALASLLRWRYWQLQNALPQTEPRCPDIHVGGPDGMSNAQCRALVLVDLAEARRRMGLPQLSRTLTRHVAEADLEQLLSWGLVVDVPDDTSFRYHLAASPLGQQHLQTCVVARMFRRKAWSADVPRNEAPQLKV